MTENTQAPEIEGQTIRKLTEVECMRLMGYTDDEIQRLKEAVDGKGRPLFSRSAIYKFAGNSVVVDVYAAIIKELAECNTKPAQGLDRYLNIESVRD